MDTARTLLLFLSSTFSDFVAEREALQKTVFPELEDYCAKRGWVSAKCLARDSTALFDY